MTRQSELLLTLRELALWGLSNLICMGLPLGGVYLYGTYRAGWGPALLGAALVITAMLTATWGSWGTLVWTRSRPLRLFQQGTTALPGVLMGGLAGLMFTMGPTFLIPAILVGASGVGMIVTAVYLSGGLFSRNQAPDALQYATGLLFYPVATTLLGAVTISLWLKLLFSDASYVAGTSLFDVFRMSRVMMGVMTAALVTTVLPALSSRLSTQLAIQARAALR